MKLSDKIKELRKHPYAIVAERCNTSVRFVGQIARGERKGLRGKGLKVKEELQKLINNQNEENNGKETVEKNS